MSKKTIRLLTILSIMLALVGAGLIVADIVGSPLTTTTTGNATTTHMSIFANLPLFVVGVVVAALALVPHQIAWAGALINLARLQQWSWFVFVLVLHGIAVLVYLIAGPTTPAGRAYAAPYMQMQPSDQPPQHSLRS
ncbi:MAG TPA: hypothetical protein VIY29_12695 [Ktedonobacteraceae bacterium]